MSIGKQSCYSVLARIQRIRSVSTFYRHRNSFVAVDVISIVQSIRRWQCIIPPNWRIQFDPSTIEGKTYHDTVPIAKGLGLLARVMTDRGLREGLPLVVHKHQEGLGPIVAYDPSVYPTGQAREFRSVPTRTATLARTTADGYVRQQPTQKSVSITCLEGWTETFSADG